MGTITEEGKLRRHRGEGHGADYKPWILAREVKGNEGVSTSLIDWKHGRPIECLSQGEKWLYCLLRWRDDVEDIREQFPLDLESTVSIANELGVMHPRDEKHRMTTDLLVDFTDGHQEAFSVKAGTDALDDARTVEKLMIEKIYWESRGVKWHLWTKDEKYRQKVLNIMEVTEFYNHTKFEDAISSIKFMIAHKHILVDMDLPIDYTAIIRSNPLCLKEKQ